MLFKRGLLNAGIKLKSLKSLRGWRRGLSSLGEEASAVVIGGGAVGCSVAYHLAQHGLKNVILLEAKSIASTAPRYPPGFVSYSHPVPSFRNVLAHSVDLYSQLEAENGQRLPFHTPGTIRLAGTRAELDDFKRYLSKDWKGAEANRNRLLSPSELEQLCPLLDQSKVLAALYCEGDGFLDPTALTRALASAAGKNGAALREGVQLQAVKAREDGLWDVETNEGTIRAIHVINASGLGAQEVASLVGVELPLVNILHHYLVTEDVASLGPDSYERVPAVVNHAHGWYLRPFKQSLLFGAFEPTDKVVLLDDKSGQEPRFDGLDERFSAASEQVPTLGQTGIQKKEAGVHCLTPDGIPLVGPVQGLNNYWLACGFFDGVATAGGVGKYLADWILEGEPSFDLIETDANRFLSWMDKKFLRERAKESYSMTLNWSLSPEERRGGRPSPRVSGIYGALVQQDAFMEYRGGWEVPAWFQQEDVNKLGALEREYKAVKERCGIIDLSHKGLIEVRGSDGAKFLDYLLTTSAPEFGHMTESLSLTPKGRINCQIQVIHHDKIPSRLRARTGVKKCQMA